MKFKVLIESEPGQFVQVDTEYQEEIVRKALGDGESAKFILRDIFLTAATVAQCIHFKEWLYPNEPMRQLTREDVMDGATSECGWSKQQLALLGLPWPPPRKWKHKIIGKMFPESSIRRFILLKKATKDTLPVGKDTRGHDATA